MDQKPHQVQPSTGPLRPPSLSLNDGYGGGAGSQYVRRRSGMSEGPITPPMSPDRSEDGGIEDLITVDSQPRFSGPSQPPMSSNFISHGPGQGDEWIQEEMDGVRPSTPPKQPVRLLEDEKVHIETSGLLKLKDFEIKGTLGGSQVEFAHCSDRYIFVRDWNFRSS